MWLYVGKVFQVEGTLSSKVLRGQKGPLRSEGSMVRKEEQPRHNVRASWSVCERGVLRSIAEGFVRTWVLL